MLADEPFFWKIIDNGDKMYKCPQGVPGRTHFSTLSGLVQHVESEACEAKRFQNQIDTVLQSVTDRMRKLTF